MSCLRVRHLGIELDLYPDGSAYSHELNSLFLADIHLGKSAHFRRAGIPTPKGVHQSTLSDLTTAVLRHPGAVVYFLGDLFHSAPNNETQELRNLLEGMRENRFVLILGNHDRNVEHWTELEVYSELDIGPIVLMHEPPGSDFDRGVPFDERAKKNWSLKKNILSGHLHPAVMLKGSGRHRVRVPVFYFNHWIGVLPAFGTFTGTKALRQQGHFYGLAENKIIDLGCYS